jgi:hypothetical protein
MTSHRYDPYLWVHLAGLATVPFWLILCLLGLAVEYPALPALELALMLSIGVLPVLYMQLKRPFCIFGVLCLALRPDALSYEQRQLLTIFRKWRVRAAALPVALGLSWIVLQLYQVAPIARDITPFSPWGRLGGLAIATLGCCGANLFLQVPISVFLVVATPNRALQGVAPYPQKTVNRDFCHVGLPVKRILPEVVVPLSPQQAQNQPVDNGDLVESSNGSGRAVVTNLTRRGHNAPPSTPTPSSFDDSSSETQSA